MSLVSLPGLKEMLEEISAQYHLPENEVQEALREALLKGYERYRRAQQLEKRIQFSEDYFDNFYVELNTEEEGFFILCTKTIVEKNKEEIEQNNETDHLLSLEDVKIWLSEDQDSEEDTFDPQAYIGQEMMVDVTPNQKDFGRMAAIQTKQVLLQKLRDRQRKMIQDEFKDLEGTVLPARVLRFERQSAIVAVTSGFGKPEVEAELPKREQLPNDNYRANATFKIFLKKVKDGTHRGPQLLASRGAAGLVVDLFATEVPEIEDEIVRIVAVAREANPPSRHVGPRTKIAVDTLERDVDPVGACIGARGSRIQAVVNELRGEKIDAIRWSPDPATYISNALSPAKVDEVRLVDAEERQALVLVPENQLSLAIGKDGQNVRLAARLTGWKIDIKDTATFKTEQAEQATMPAPEEEPIAPAEPETEIIEPAFAIAEEE